MPQFDEQRFEVASRLHDHDGMTGFLEGFDPSTDLIFVIADCFRGRPLEFIDIDFFFGNIDTNAR
ncbi:MAG: hypothetical protein O3B13_21655 [Planctomycetota bacterium]|nr:hypothetical protein [Planctomycetota bacterium]